MDMFTARRLPSARTMPFPSLFEPVGMPLGSFPGFGMMEELQAALVDGLEGLHGSPGTVHSSRAVSRDGNSVTTTTRTFGHPTVCVQTSISTPQRRPRQRSSHRGAFGSLFFDPDGSSDSDDEDKDGFLMWQRQPPASRMHLASPSSRMHTASPSSHADDMMACMAAMAEDFAGMATLPSLMGGFGPSLMEPSFSSFPSSFSSTFPATTRAAPRPTTASRASRASRSGPRAVDEGEEAVQEMSCRVVNKDPEQRCPVCLEDVEVDEPMRALVPCGHTVHHLCLKRAFQGKLDRDGASDVGWQCIVCRHALK